MDRPPPSPEDARALEAAARLLETAGHDGFTMDRLAEATGLSRATLYRRFGGRDAILQRLSEDGLIDGRPGDPPDIRTRILNAARTVFVRNGLAGASIEEIAREAGVGAATVYRHFKDRDGLILAFAEQMRPIGWGREIPLEPSGDLEADLHRLVSHLVRSLYANRDLMLLMLSENLRHPELIQRMSGSPERTQHRLAAWLDARIAAGQLEPGDSFQMAAALVGMLMSLAVLSPAFYGRPVEDPDALARFIVRVFLDGLRTGPKRHT